MNNQYSDPLLDELELHQREVERRIALLSTRIRNAPVGSLKVAIKNNKSYYYQRTNSGSVNNTYLPREDLPIARMLAQKDYDERLLKVLEEQLKSIEQFLKNYDPAAPLKVYENLSGPRKALVKPEFLTDEEYVKRWLSVPYRKMGFKANDPEFYTTGGERVRSKSEVIIAEALMRHNIPFR